MKTKLNVFISAISDLFIPMIIVFLFLSAMCLGSCSHGDKVYVYFGDDGYVQYNNVRTGDIMLLNDSDRPYYVSTFVSYCTHRTWVGQFFCAGGSDSIVSKEIRIVPGDTVFIHSPTRITDRWKGIDGCGHPIPFHYVEYVGYWEDGVFHRKE